MTPGLLFRDHISTFRPTDGLKLVAINRLGDNLN